MALDRAEQVDLAREAMARAVGLDPRLRLLDPGNPDVFFVPAGDVHYYRGLALQVMGRGGEAIDMLQAMNTGHDGSLTTIHANTPRDALARIETMIQMTGMRLSDRAMRQQVASALDLVVQAARHSDGSRRVTSISEITGMEGDTITMQEIFLYERTGMDSHGQVLGRFRTTGIRPRFAEKLKACGMQLPRIFFEDI